MGSWWSYWPKKYKYSQNILFPLPKFLYKATLWYNAPVNNKISYVPNIGLNAHLLSLKQSYRSAGISWYIYNLLINLPTANPNHLYTAFLSDRQFQTKGHKNIITQHSRWPTTKPLLRIAWEQTMLPLILAKQKINLLHAMAFVAPVVMPCPFVITIYDLSFLHYPKAFKTINRFYLSTFTRHSTKQAKAIITISESTRQDVIKAFNIAPHKVHTIYCGVDNSFKPLATAQINAFKAKHGLPDKFIFRLGTIEPRKNVEGVIKAYAAWKAKDKQVPKLVIAGGKGWYYQQVFDLIETLNLTDSVIFPGYLPQQDLPLWYNAATLFVYPSFFEGFGLPVVEAMACGTPVITSNISSLPEVAGESALLINPTDINALSEAMQTVWYTPNLAQTMRQQGFIQAAKFSWAKAAAQTAQIYQQTLFPKTT